jgi:hypothetical protein
MYQDTVGWARGQNVDRNVRKPNGENNTTIEGDGEMGRKNTGYKRDGCEDGKRMAGSFVPTELCPQILPSRD